MTKRKTNIEVVEHLMERCPTGALGQAFIMAAISSYAAEVMRRDDAALDTTFIDRVSWRQTAQWMRVELDKQYK